MSREGLRGRAAGRLRLRLIVLLVLFAVMLTGAAYLWTADAVEAALEREYRRSLELRSAGVERVVGRIGDELAARLTRIAAALDADPDGRGRLLRGGADALDVARRLGEREGLELLEVLGADGVVISSRHWPQRAGLEEPSLTRIEPGQPTIRRVDGPDGGSLAVLLAAPLREELDRLRLVAGKRLDGRFLERVAAGDPAMLIERDRRGNVARRIDHGEAFDEADPRWSTLRRDLHDAAGELQGELHLALERAGLRELQGRLRIVFGAIGFVAALLAAAIAGRASSGIGRPLDRLVRAVDAIAAGEADYTFPDSPQDELDELAQAFSRLQRSLELQRQRSASAERIAAWRDVARHVAHEVKNPLAPIRLTIDNLVRARERDPRLFDEMFEDGARTIREEVEQLRRLVEAFSEFARLPAPRREPVDLHGLIDGVLDLFAADADLKIVRTYRAGDAMPSLDRDQAARAVKNVVLNAVQAMREAATRAPQLEIRTEAGDGMVTLELRDTGPGFPPDAVERVFEPYFTTKQAGTGLGMAIAYRIVTEHGGTIRAENRKEGGASVTIRLPQDDGERR